MTFTEKYSKILSVVQEYINKIDLFDGIDIKEPLRSKLYELLNAPSKHIRPLVSFLYLKAIDADIDKKQIEYQTAIELVHNASLIHDDVIDDGEIRRSRKTLNKDFDSKLAVMAGDYLLSVAMKKVVDIGLPKLVDMFCETLEIMVTGEINQYFARFKMPDIEEYIAKTEQKTSKLFEVAIDGACIIASRSEQNKKKHRIFAQNFGIAFQIRDDLINCMTSKSDISEGVYTAPVIFSGDIDITVEGIAKTKALLNNYLDKALGALADIEDNEYKRALEELVELLRNE